MSDQPKKKLILEPLVPLSGARSKTISTSANPKAGTTAVANVAPEKSTKKVAGYKDVINRTVFTILMFYIFLACISIGIRFGVLLLVVIFTTVFSEITRINQRIRKERQLPSVNIIKWYFFIVTTSSVVLYGLREPMQNTYGWSKKMYELLPFVSFCGIMLGIVIFVLSLRKGMYRYQFIQFTWCTMTLMLTTAQIIGELRNMVRGMIWFLLPVVSVINNDIWAYVVGKMFGRTKLLSLSPKKTVEGFIGAFLITVVWSFWFCGFLSYFPEMYCPAVGFTNAVNAKCERNPIFIQEEVEFPQWLQEVSGNFMTTFMVSPAQVHAVVLGTFAALLAPFGGFFASGLKRAFKLKDFGDLIPGHGGMTDRMDCQGIMALFTYFYLRTYLFHEPKCPSLDDITSCALRMDVEHRTSLVHLLTQSLKG